MPLKFATNQSLTSVTALPSSVPTDNLILISTQTASSSATISFTTGLDSTYDEYIFKFINVHPQTDNIDFHFQVSTNGGSSYGVAITSTNFIAGHSEADDNTSLSYRTAGDLAQSTDYQVLHEYNNLGNDADQSLAGTLTLFNPSSTTYVKHFIATTNITEQNDYQVNIFIAGYVNTTSAVNAIQFKMASGNIDDGIIKLYGVKKS
jgi:hypothetical protein